MNYRVFVTDEAIDDIFNLVKYIYVDLCNPDAADKLYVNLKQEVNKYQHTCYYLIVFPHKLC